MHQPIINDLTSRQQQHAALFANHAGPAHLAAAIDRASLAAAPSAPLSSIIRHPQFTFGPQWDAASARKAAMSGSSGSSPPLSPTTSTSTSLSTHSALSLSPAPQLDANKQRQLAARDDQQRAPNGHEAVSERSSNIATADDADNNRRSPPPASDLIRSRNAPGRNSSSSRYHRRPSHSAVHNSCAKLEASSERPPPPPLASPLPHRLAIEAQFTSRVEPHYGAEVLPEHCTDQPAVSVGGAGGVRKWAPNENPFVDQNATATLLGQVAAGSTKPMPELLQSTAVDVGCFGSTAAAVAGGTYAHNRLQQLEQPLQRRQRLQQQQQQRGKDQKSRADFLEEEEAAEEQVNKSPENCRAKRTSKDDGNRGRGSSQEQRKTIPTVGRDHNYHDAIGDEEKASEGHSRRTGHFASAAAVGTPLDAVAVDDCGPHHGDPRMGRSAEEQSASPTFVTPCANKPCTYRRRLQLTSDTDNELSADTALRSPGPWQLGSSLHQQQPPRPRVIASSASSPSIASSARQYRHYQYRLPGDHRVHRRKTVSTSTCRLNEAFDSSKTATPSALRVKLFRHSASHPESGNLEEATEQLLPEEPASRGDHAPACSGPPSSTIKYPATSGFVSWHELRNKLIGLQRKANKRRKRKRSWTLSLPSSQSFSASGGRLVINRNLLHEFRSRFRRSSNPLSLLYFDNPVSATNSSSVNYSYYNFFYYPSRDPKGGSSTEGPIAAPANTEATTNEPSPPLDTGRELTCPNRTAAVAESYSVRSGCEAKCDLHQYHRLHHHHHPTSSLTSLLSITSPSASSPVAASPIDCCKHHFQCAGIDPERNQLLPHSTSADQALNTHTHPPQYLRRFGLGNRHYHHHHHNHRNSLCTSLLDSDLKVDASTPSLSSGSFHHHHPRSAEVASPNSCLSTIMEILPLLLLLTMGVIISTTCAKYTFHSPSLPASAPSVSASAAFHHRGYGGQFETTKESSPLQSNDAAATDSHQPSSGAGNRPDPPYLMMMQNDDEYSASHTHTEADSSVESFDGSSVVDETMKKSAVGRSFQPKQHHHHGHQAQPGQPGSGSHYHQQQMLAQLAHQYSAMQLHWLSNTSVTCNDGTRAGFYVRHSPSSRRWLIYLEGGWYCMSKSTCDQRWSKMREFMTSFRWTQYKTFNGILSSSPAVNPYWWDANHVFVPYCSSDIWSGNSAAARGEMAFLGSRIIDEVIKELIQSPVYRFTDAKFVLMAGSSAGAAGVMINLDRVARTIADSGSKADVRGLADSGWVLESDYLDQVAKGKQHKSHHPKPHAAPCTDATVDCSPMDSIRGAFKLWNSRVPDACVERFPTEPWRCFYGYRLYPTLQTPLFIVQFQYDEFQIHVDGISRGSRGWNDHERMQYIRLLSDSIRSTLSNVSAVFAPACMSHIVLTKPEWNKVSIQGVTLPEALHCWEETPMANSLTRTRFDPFSFFQQYPHLYQPYNNNKQLHHKLSPQFNLPANSNNLNGFYKSPPYYQPPGGRLQSASQKIFSMYPYGMPVVTSDGAHSNGNGAAVSSSEINIDLESADEDELSQYYSNGRQLTFSYGNSAGASAANAHKKSPIAGSSSNSNNYFSNSPDDLMANDDPRVVTPDSGKPSEHQKSSSLPSTSASDHSKVSSTSDGVKSALSGDENSIAILGGNTSAPDLHKSASSSGQQTGGHGQHNQRKQEKRRKKRKRRKHMQRRSHASSSTTTTAPSMANSVIGYKPKRTSSLEDNLIKPSPPLQPLYQNDGAPVAPHQSRSRKHRPNRVSTNPYDLTVGGHSFGREPWSLSGGDDGVSSAADSFPGKCHFRLIDDDKFPKTNGFGCPYFRD